MSPTSRDDAVETVRSRTDIVELIGRYLRLKKVGNRYVGLCPFHAEKTPSFSVSPQKGFFYCFGCQASGDSFTFLMRMEGKTFPEALEDLAARAGVDLPARRTVDPQKRERKQRLLGLLERAASFYEECLWRGEAGRIAREYLRSRGVSEDLARRFRLGCAPAGWQNLGDHLRRTDSSSDDALAVGLLVTGKGRPYDFFRNRLIVPITGLDDKVRGFGARKLDPEDQGGKYINSPQGPVFDKSDILYGLAPARPAIRRNSRVILVEGYFDVLSLVAVGIDEVAATCGTSLTEGHARLIKRFCERVICVFDADEAGLKASFRAAETLLGRDISPYMLLLPTGEDPDSFVRKHGREAFEELLAGARPTVEVLSDRMATDAGSDVEARTRAMKRLLPLLAACTDSVRLGGYLRLVAERFRIDERNIRESLQKQKRRNFSRQGPVSSSDAEQPEERVSKKEIHCLSLLVQHPQLARIITENNVVDLVSSDTVRELLVGFLDKRDESSPAARLSQIKHSAILEKLTAALMNADERSEESTREDLACTIKEIRMAKLQRNVGQLQERIEQSERDGRGEESRDLQVEKLRLSRELKALDLAIKRGP